MARTKSSAKSSKAPAATKKAAAKPAAKAAPKAVAPKTAAPKTVVRETKTETRTDVKMGWSSAIKKALQDKGEQPNWPGSGDAWKRKNKV